MSAQPHEVRAEKRFVCWWERTFYQWMEHHVECALSLSVGEVRLEECT